MPMKLKSMKGMDFSCTSPASTAICSSMDQRSMVRNGTKSLNRLNSYLGDQYKTFTNNISNHSPTNRAPCISELPFTPRPSSFSSYREKSQKTASAVKHSDVVLRRRSSADVVDLKRYKNNSTYSYDDNGHSSHSSRYLLGESKFLDSLSENEMNHARNNYHTNHSHSSNTVPSTPVFGSEARRSTSRFETRRFGSMLDAEKERQQILKHFSLIKVSDQPGTKSVNTPKRTTRETHCDGQNGHSQRHQPKSMGNSTRSDSIVQKSTSSARSRDQVVVLRVSLHCKGCAGKLKKHLSRMEGVKSFSIDLETKKVTVTGNVTPLEVLTSISRVKNAQFWPSPASASASSTSTSSSSSSTSSTADFN